MRCQDVMLRTFSINTMERYHGIYLALSVLKYIEDLPLVLATRNAALFERTIIELRVRYQVDMSLED